MPDNSISQAFVARPVCNTTVRHLGGIAITEANCDGRPILLTSHPQFNCSDDYRGEGPCCKANFAFWYMLSRPGLFDTVRWVSFGDDDVYYHPPGIFDLLARVDSHANSSVERLAIVPKGKCSRIVVHPSQSVPKCLLTLKDMFWAFPLFLSRAAVLGAEVGFRGGGVIEQCMTLNVSHEAGLGEFLWMYNVGCIGISETNPRVYLATGGEYGHLKTFAPEAVIIHRVREHSSGYATMFDIEEQLAKRSSYIDPNFTASKDALHRVKRTTGYQNTVHSATYNISEHWAAMSTSDCAPRPDLRDQMQADEDARVIVSITNITAKVREHRGSLLLNQTRNGTRPMKYSDRLKRAHELDFMLSSLETTMAKARARVQVRQNRTGGLLRQRD